MKKFAFKPLLFSKAFGLNPTDLDKIGVFDVSLNLDTNLFPDPLLLSKSSHPEMHAARKHFEEYFERVRKLVAASGGDDSTKAWRTAKRLLHFPEMKGTCLGYGVANIAGSGVGKRNAKPVDENRA